MESENNQSPIQELLSIISSEESFFAQPSIRDKITGLLKKLEDENQSLEEKAALADQKASKAISENEKLRNQIKELQEELQEKRQQVTNYHQQATQNNAKLEEMQKVLDGMEKVGKPIQLSIETHSLFDLNGDGWKIKCDDDKIMKKHTELGVVSASVLGDFDAGKSFLLNELGACFDSGYSKRTNAILISLPKTEGSYYALIDTPGSKEAIQIYNEELLKKLKNNLMDELTYDDTPKADDKNLVKSPEQIADDEAKLHQMRYRHLHNDRKIIDNLKEKFIIESADIIFIVVGKLSESESEMIQRNISYYEKIMNSNNTKKKN